MSNKLKKLKQQIETKCGNIYCFTETTRTLKGKYITISHNVAYDDVFTIYFNNNSLRIELKTISSVIDFIVNNIADDFTTRLDLFPMCK